MFSLFKNKHSFEKEYKLVKLHKKCMSWSKETKMVSYPFCLPKGV